MLGGHSMDALFGGVLKEDEEKKKEEAEEKRRAKKPRVVRRRDERGRLVVVDPQSLQAEDIMATPGWMRKDPKWLQRQILEDAGLVEDEQEVRVRNELSRVEMPSEAEREKAELYWEELGGLPGGEHDRWDSSSSGSDGGGAERALNAPSRKKRRTNLTATDDPDAGAAGPTLLYNFCLNPQCPTYRLADNTVQQKWYGECCGMRNQARGRGALHAHEKGGEEEGDKSGEQAEDTPMEEVEEGGDGSDDEEWDITEDVLDDIAATDPDTAAMLKKIKAAEKAKDVPEVRAEVCPKDVAVTAALVLAYLCTPYPESEEEDEDEEDEEEEEEEEDEFVERCEGLLAAIVVALTSETGEYKPCEPFVSLKADLEGRVAAFKAGDVEFDPFRSAALELIRNLRQEFWVHKRASRPPNKKIEIDGVTYDI